MKILFVATVDIHIINHHLRIINKLRKLGHEIDVASLGDFRNKDFNKKYNVCFSKNPFSINNIKAYFIMRKLLLENNYDVISCHTPLASFFTRIAARKVGAKVIYTAHGFHFYKNAPIINQVIFKTMERIAARFTDTIITINEEDFDSAKKFKVKSDGKVLKIPGVGIDINHEIDEINESKTTKETLGFLDDDILLISVGELNANKNHLFVIESLKEELIKNKKLHYVICGSGPMKNRYEELIMELGLVEKVHLLGYREDIYEILNVSNLFIFPSHREGLPVSVLEAMVAKLPILASKVRGNIDLIEDGTNGMLFDPNNKDEFKMKFFELFEDKTKQEKFIRRNCDVVESFDIKMVDQLILALYE